MPHQILLAVICVSLCGIVFGTSCQVTYNDHSQGLRTCDAEFKVGSIINQNMNCYCLIHRRPILQFGDCDGQPTDIDANNETEYYHNNGSGCFHYNESMMHGDLHSDIMFIYSTRVTLNTSLIYKIQDSPPDGPGMYDIICDFHIWEAINGTCSSHGNSGASRQSLCHKDDITVTVTIISVQIKDQNITVMVNFNDAKYEINKEFIDYCTAITASTIPTTSTYGSRPISLSSTNSYRYNPSHFYNTSTNESLAISSSMMNQDKESPPSAIGLIAGISTSILVLAIVIIILIVILLVYTRRKATIQKQDSEYQDIDGPYSTLHQGESNQSQLQQTNANLYEQVHLNPSTEFIPSAESETISNISWQPQDDFPAPQQYLMEEDDPTYAVVGKENDTEQSKIDKISSDGPPVPSDNHINDKASTTDDNEPNEEMYAVINKKRKVEKEEEAPPIPPYMADDLHMPAVNDEEAPPITRDKVEELYTAVKKKPKEEKNDEVAPPLPPDTVEKLYSAIIKMSKVSTEDEEEIPPVPPHTGDMLCTIVDK